MELDMSYAIEAVEREMFKRVAQKEASKGKETHSNRIIKKIKESEE